MDIRALHDDTEWNSTEREREYDIYVIYCEPHPLVHSAHQFRQSHCIPSGQRTETGIERCETAMPTTSGRPWSKQKKKRMKGEANNHKKISLGINLYAQMWIMQIYTHTHSTQHITTQLP